MVQGIIGILIFILIAIAIIVMIIINFAYKGIKKMRQNAEDNYYRTQKEKEQKEKNPFDADYFKSSNPGQNNKWKKNSGYTQQKQQSTSNTNTENTARKTSTSSGVTIIDDRNTEEKRKIFEHSEGEYVEFEEV